MGYLITWWSHAYPHGTPQSPEYHLSVLDLYREYVSTLDPSQIVDPNQFAKMLVAASIYDMGNGWWFRDPTTPAKDYEIRRATVGSHGQ
jgi:hypothetical protein